ncbi:ATP-binding cassette domain-containing protein [Halomonas mongoliensis]|uniref:ATP-binding cassette domain-containing protein n=1 Tax=Halomonas mongoliensis TaxID=321265 RepID=A0ABU1GLQ6_9GAMM|nr:oligopeptide/dipeptide ABC transporter ATP-binding protein [Halomonas mongoliensis]MDR5892972.1 ATP-binding cassette domain-containing protein [Halomonas mongoliensis]
MSRTQPVQTGSRQTGSRQTGSPRTAEGGEVLLEATDLARHFDVSKPWLNRVLERAERLTLKAVDGVSFSIRRGETLALVGESGCGKSTVARLIVGLYGLTRGRLVFDGQEISDLARRSGRQAAPIRQRFQMIFQDPYASLNPLWRVGTIIGEPLRFFRPEMSSVDRRRRVGELLEQVGMSAADANRYPHEFSGGQRQRISIARALANEPEFMVCDEPTSALDVSVQAQILNLMKDLQQEYGLTYLFISHDMAVVKHMADRIAVMYLGRIAEIAPSDQLFATPHHPYSRMLLAAVPSLEGEGRERTVIEGEVPNPVHPPSGCAFHPRCPHANERCKAEVPALIARSDGSEVACHAVEEGRLD